MKDQKFTGWVYNCPAPGKRTYFVNGKAGRSHVVKRQKGEAVSDNPRQMTLPMTDKQRDKYGRKVTD